jgi:hypothetical protein
MMDNIMPFLQLNGPDTVENPAPCPPAGQDNIRIFFGSLEF